MNLEDMVVKIDTDNRFTYVNESYCKTFGKSPDELIGKNFIPLVHEDDQESTLKAMAGLHKPPFKAYIEQRAMTADGWKWFAQVNTSILDEKNEVVEIIGVGRDISEIKKSQLVIEQSEARFRHLFEDFPISLWEEDGSELLDYVKGLRSQGIKDFASYFSNLPVDDILDIAKMLKVVNINKASISMYQAEEKNDLIGNLDKTFLPESLPVFIEEISCLASGQTSFSSEGVTQTLKGKK